MLTKKILFENLNRLVCIWIHVYRIDKTVQSITSLLWNKARTKSDQSINQTISVVFFILTLALTFIDLAISIQNNAQIDQNREHKNKS